MDVQQPGIRQHILDIDEAVAVFHPEARAEILGDDGIGGLDANALCGFFAQRRDQFADDKGQQRENETDAQQRKRQAGNRDAAHAQHDEFGIACKLRQRIHGADQHRYRHHLVNMAGSAQQHEQQHLVDAIAAFADVLQLLNQVEEREHGQQRQHDEQDAGGDFLGQVTMDDLHFLNRRHRLDNSGAWKIRR